MPTHPYIDKYCPSNYKPKIYNFLDDFSDAELSDVHQISSNFEPSQTEDYLQHLAQKVNNKYRFKKIKYGDLVLNPVNIKEGEVDCYGYTLALSQILQYANIKHSLAFANTHAFIVANQTDSKESIYYLLDALSPEISGKIDDSAICHIGCIGDNYFAINIHKYLENINTCSDIEAFLTSHPWTHFKNTNASPNTVHCKEIPDTNNNIYAKLFSPSEGANILYANDELRYNLATNNLSKAYMLSKFVAQNYPEIDIRNKPYTIQKLIEKLGSIGLTQLASQTIDRTANARQIQGTVAHDIWRSDEYKKLGKRTGKPEFLEMSRVILDNIVDNREEPMSASANQLIRFKQNKLLKLFKRG